MKVSVRTYLLPMASKYWTTAFFFKGRPFFRGIMGRHDHQAVFPQLTDSAYRMQVENMR